MRDKILFLCSANVGRSQMAEGYYNFFTKSQNAMSAGLIEDRREKYNHQPSDMIQTVMLEDGVNISGQRIEILTSDLCEQADKIVLLLEVENKQSEFKIHNQSPLDFLYKYHNDKLIMYPMADPFNADREFTIATRNLIKKFVVTFV